MAYKRFRIVLSKGWTLLVCSLSVATLALMASCRSKKVTKAEEPEPEKEDVNEAAARRTNSDLAPSVALPSDSKEVKEMISEVNSLKDELSGRMNSVIYGPPEVMQRRAQENNEIRAKIDSLTTEINKARKK